MQETIIAIKLKALDLLRFQYIYFLTYKDCRKITPVLCKVEAEPMSYQEEADTKIVLHCFHALTRHPLKKILIRSPSGDTDDHAYLDYGNGIHRKGLSLADIDLPDEIKKCILGFHAFTGNDYISSFFQKGKMACWKIVEKYPRFVSNFTSLGLLWELEEELADALEEYICLLYGSRKKKVNDGRREIFERKHVNQRKVIDISHFPPCRSTLLLHSKRANVIAKIWNSSHEPMLEEPDFTHNGWNSSLEICWMDEAIPRDMNRILLEPLYDADGDIDCGLDEESDEQD